MRTVNQNKTKGVRVMNGQNYLGAKGWSLREHCDWAANYVKYIDYDILCVMTIYRYGKTAYMTYTSDEYLAWRSDIDGTKELALADVKKWGA